MKKSKDMKSTKPKKKPSTSGGGVPAADESGPDPATEPESEVSKKPVMKAKATSKKAAQKRSGPAGTSTQAESGSEDQPLLKRPAAAPKTVAKAKAEKTKQARKYWYYADKKIGIKYDGHERMTVVVSDQFRWYSVFEWRQSVFNYLQQIEIVAND